MTERIIEVPISRSNYNSALEAFLRQIGVIQYSEDVAYLSVIDSSPELITLMVKLKKQEEAPKEELTPIILDKGVPEEDLEIPDFLKREKPQSPLDFLRKFT